VAWVAVAVAGTALVGGALQSGAASDAANAQANAAANAQGISQQEFKTITQQNAPYMQAGYGALSNLDYLLGITPQTATGGVPQQPGSTNNTVPRGTGQIGGFGLFGGSQNGLSNFPATGHDARTGQVIPRQTLYPTGPPGMQPDTPATGSPAGGFGSLVKPFDATDWQQLSPAYQFQLQQGRQGVLNADTSGQGALSGSAMKDLIDYNRAISSVGFPESQDWVNRVPIMSVSRARP
jgi:hypothetical protein